MKKIILIFILFFGILTAILLPYYLQYSEPYFAPTVINGINILKYGHIDYNTADIAQQRLKSDLDIEESYPAPGILTAALLAVTNLPYVKLAYIPIAGIAFFLYFALAKYVLPDKYRALAAMLAIAYFWLNLSNFLASLTTGRANLGTMLLVLFIICYLHLLDSPSHKFIPWLIICVIITIMSSLTYYTSTLAIIIIVAICSIVTRNRFRSALNEASNVILPPRGFSILVLAIFLFLLPPILSSIAPHLDLQTFIRHIYDTFLSKLGQEGTESGNLYGLVFQNNFVSQVRLWSTRILLLLTIVSTVFIIIAGILNPEKRYTRQWLYAIIAVGACCSELPYVFYTYTIPDRFLIYYASLSVFCAIFLFNKIRKPLSLIIIALVLIVVCTDFSFYLQRGDANAAKPFAIEKIQPLANYISKDVATGSIAADACYTANLWLFLTNNNRNAAVSVLPLGEAATLLQQAQNGSVTPFVHALNENNIQYLLLNFDGMPFYGDVWGYAALLYPGKWVDALPLDLIYSDGRFMFFDSLPTYLLRNQM